jgi:hypothetical protein
MMLVNEEHRTSQDDSTILHPSSRALFRFWEATRGSRAAPDRGDIDLHHIRDLVPNLAIIERASRSARFRWRLAGTLVCDLYRLELTGRDFLAGWDSFESDVIGRFLGGVVQSLQPCVLRFRLTTNFNQAIGVEMIGLPVLPEGSRGIQIFAGVFSFPDDTLLGYRFIAGMELSSARSIWLEHLPGDVLVSRINQNEHQPNRAFRVIDGGRS